MVRRNGSRVRCFTKAAQDAVTSLTKQNAELAAKKPGKPVAIDAEAIHADAEAKAAAAPAAKAASIALAGAVLTLAQTGTGRRRAVGSRVVLGSRMQFSVHCRGASWQLNRPKPPHLSTA